MIPDRLYGFYVFILLFALTACKGKKEYEALKIISEWEGREIVFPNNLTFARYALDTVDYKLTTSSQYRVLVYVDSLGCASCKLQLDRWNNFISHIDSLSSGSCQFLFFIHSREPKEISYLLKRYRFDLPVCIDMDDSLNKLNKFPGEILFQTFLLNAENKVLYVGNPIYSPAVSDLYEMEIVGKKKIRSNDKIAMVKQPEINLGTFSLGDNKTAVFEIENKSGTPLVIQDVNTACDCMSISFDKEPVLSNKYLRVEVNVKPKDKGFFSHVIIVKCSAGQPVKLCVIGHVL